MVLRYLERLAAQGALLLQDDTAVRILSLLDEHPGVAGQAEARGFSRATERTGMYTTALVVTVGEHPLCCSSSGRAHAGENRQALWPQRPAGQDKPVGMSEALSSNAADEARLIRWHCLAHGRRTVSDLAEGLPLECQVGCEALTQVYDHDAVARTEQMAAPGRLASHQTYRRPLREGRKKWLKKPFEARLVAPQRSLGQAIASLQGPCETLRRFGEVAGAPLEHNIAERALKPCRRQRKNVLFYKTEHRAYIASGLTSLIATGRHAGVNAVDDLVGL